MQYGIFRCEWRDDPRLDMPLLALLAVLCTYTDKDGTCWPAQGTIAKRLGRSRPWVNAQIARLVEFGILTSERRRYPNRGEKTCLYRFAPPADTPCQPRADTNTTNTIKKAPTEPVRPKDDEVIRVATEVPDGWLPTQDDISFLSRERPDLFANPRQIRRATLRFVTNAQARGLRYADISAAWRCWIINERMPPAAPAKARTKQDDLSERNAAAAQATLERLMARRSNPPAS